MGIIILGLDICTLAMNNRQTRRSLLGALGVGGLTAMIGTAAGTPGQGQPDRGGRDRDKPDRGKRDATFVAPLTAGQSTKVKTSGGKGYARLFYDRDGNGELTYSIEYEGDLDITQIHIHHAEPQTVDNRLTVFLKKYTESTTGADPDGDSPVSPPRTVTGSVNNPAELKAEDPAVDDEVDGIVQDILEEPSAFQINTHTTRSPGGEIRGQLRGSPVKNP